MRRPMWRPLLYLSILGMPLFAQRPLTWSEVRERFQQNNPSLLAGKLNIDESRATEITASLRPNPQLGFTADEFRIFHPNPLQPFQNAQITPTLQQLFERGNKRQLRVDSARLNTQGVTFDQQDFERNLVFDLRNSFIGVLLAKALLQLAQDNLAYYDQVVAVNNERFKAGEISRVDFVRVDLQHVQFESDLINAQVNLKNAKIQLLAFMNERRPVDQFDVTGPFEFKEKIVVLDEVRNLALSLRPDLQSAKIAVDKARADNRLAIANGTTDPTLGLEYQRIGPDNTAGFFVGFPLRIFDRNQGEKARTALVIQQSERTRQSIETNILRDVESNLATFESVVALLKPYRDKYIPESIEIRDKVSFAYNNGGASLLDFLDAQRSYRDTQVAYTNLIGNYYAAANQLNMAVSQEIIQ